MKRPARHLLLLLALLAAAPTVSSQQTAAPLPGRDSAEAPSYIFVSPNTRVGLTLGEASRGLDSGEEVELILAARDVSCRLGVKSSVVKAVGNWTDGGEHSVLIRVVDDEASVLYAGAWLGRRFGQKGIMHFRADERGRARMYVVRTRRGGLAWLSGVLDRSGVSNRTIVPGRDGAAVYVVDLEGGLRREVARAARRLRGRLRVLSGTGGFVGDEAEASKARAVFTEVIGRYEDAHPQVKRECARRRAAR